MRKKGAQRTNNTGAALIPQNALWQIVWYSTSNSPPRFWKEGWQRGARKPCMPQRGTRKAHSPAERRALGREDRLRAALSSNRLSLCFWRRTSWNKCQPWQPWQARRCQRTQRLPSSSRTAHRRGYRRGARSRRRRRLGMSSVRPGTWRNLQSDALVIMTCS